MTSSIRNAVIFTLVLLSIFAMAAHKLGYFSIKLNLLSDANHSSIYPYSTDNITKSFNNNEDNIYLKCTVLYNITANYCAITIMLSSNATFPEVKKGIDLSIYQTLDADIDYSSPIGNPNLRISLRNYNPAYSREGDYTSLKYNSIAFQPHYENSTASMPLSSFSVENWWIKQNNLGSAESQVEVNNVAYIEILPNEIAQISDYEITVNRLILRGQRISETTLLITIIGFWLILIIVLVQNNRNNLKLIATTDSLTECINRRGLMKWLHNKLNKRSNKQSITVFYLDIDDFKKINDNYGHNTGDELLYEFTKRLKNTSNSYFQAKQDYRISRLAGDEFAIVAFNLNEDSSKQFSENLISIITRTIYLENCTLNISVSMGVVYTKELNEKIENLIDKADMAMYYAKKQGKNQFKLFDEEIIKNVYFRKKTAKTLKKAVSNQSFHLNFMPIYNCKNKQIVGVEVLLRCDDKNMQGIGPDVYIPIAEEFNLIHDIDMWVIETSFKTIQQESKLANQNITVCINISASELNHEQFVDKFQTLLKNYNIQPNNIELEITETSLIDVNKKIITHLQNIRKLGVKLALDDFGTGYTAFNQLIQYPVNTLKIDKSFIDNFTLADNKKIIMLNAILSIAKAYKLQTVVEGIETQEQLNFMQEHGCDMAQGYLLSKPLSLDDFLTLIN